MNERQPDGYVMEVEDMQRLEVIMRRLYDDRPLHGDQRRDLANAMFYILEDIKRGGKVNKGDVI